MRIGSLPVVGMSLTGFLLKTVKTISSKLFVQIVGGERVWQSLYVLHHHGFHCSNLALR